MIKRWYQMLVENMSDHCDELHEYPTWTRYFVLAVFIFNLIYGPIRINELAGIAFPAGSMDDIRYRLVTGMFVVTTILFIPMLLCMYGKNRD